MVFGGFLAAALFLGCENEATHVIIDRGERIGAPTYLQVSGENDYTSDYISVYFTPSPEALTHTVFAAHSADKRNYYVIGGSSSSGSGGSSYGSTSFSISKSGISGFSKYTYYGNTQYWSLSNTLYIGVASFNHGNAYSEITWSSDLYYSYTQPPTYYPPSGGNYNPSGTWYFTSNQGTGISFTIQISGSSWYFYSNNNTSGTYDDYGTFSQTGNTATLYSSYSGTYIGNATITSDYIYLTLTSTSSPSYTGNYTGIRQSYY